MLSSEWEVANEIYLAAVGAIACLRVDRRLCCLPRCRIRDPRTPNSRSHLRHHTVV
jgi:hypothetical protein